MSSVKLPTSKANYSAEAAPSVAKGERTVAEKVSSAAQGALSFMAEVAVDLTGRLKGYGEKELKFEKAVLREVARKYDTPGYNLDSEPQI